MRNSFGGGGSGESRSFIGGTLARVCGRTVGSGLRTLCGAALCTCARAGFAASLRADLSPYGVRVTEIVPGRVETQLYKDILDAAAIRAMYAGNVAVQPEDVAKMVVALLSLPQAADVTRFDIMPTRPTSPSGTIAGAPKA